MRQSDLNNSDQNLFIAAKNGDAKQVDLLLSQGADVNAADAHGRTALLNAALCGYADVVGLLLERGANINAADARGRTAWMAAVYYGRADVVGLLLERGANVNAANAAGRTALMLAALYRHADVVGLLLRHGANINAADDRGVTALMAAVFYGPSDVNVVKMLLDRGVNVNAADARGVTALMAAAYVHEDVKVVKMLLISGAKIQPQLQGNAVVEVAIKSIAEERADHRLMCHGITQSLTAEKDAYMTPADSKKFNPNLMSMLPPEVAEKIATMSASGDIPYDVASRISNEVVNDQKEEARAADAGIDDEKQQSTCEQIMTNFVIS